MYKIPANEPMLNAPNNLVHGKLLITAVQNFVVPDGVFQLCVSLCDAGADGVTGAAGAAGAGGAGGAFALWQPVQVTPGMVILCSPGLTASAVTTFGAFSITKQAGPVGGGDFIVPATAALGGQGGSVPMFGCGGVGGTSATNGGNAVGYGAGGGGGGGDGSASSTAGGSHANGAILVEW
jgi:hypothetical protein